MPLETATYAKGMILLEIGLIVAILVYFVSMDLYIRGCENL